MLNLLFDGFNNFIIFKSVSDLQFDPSPFGLNDHPPPPCSLINEDKQPGTSPAPWADDAAPSLPRRSSEVGKLAVATAGGMRQPPPPPLAWA